MSFCPPSDGKKKHVELENQEDITKVANKTNRYRLVKSLGKGVGRKKMAEPVPKSDLKDSDVVTKGSNNNEIVLTTDFGRGGIFSGAGRGRTGAGAIDLVVGRGASDKSGPKANIWKRPNIASDAARIYISQKTDIDANFGLAPGTIGSAKNRSGIGIKADHVRLIGREGIKIITGKMQGIKGAGSGGEKSSSGGKVVQPAPPIELIAGNNTEPSNRLKLMVPNVIPEADPGQSASNGTSTWSAQSKSHSVDGHSSGPGSASADGRPSTAQTLQPVPVGYNLADALDDIVQLINNLQSVMLHFAKSQIKINQALALHGHGAIPPVVGGPVLPSVSLGTTAFKESLMLLDKVVIGLVDIRYNSMAVEMNYTEPFGAKWICSRGVKVSV